MAKEWSWSFSKKKNYDNCPKKYYEVDIQKNFGESTEQLDYGNAVHKALADACSGVTNLPEPYLLYQPWVDIVKASPGKLKVEEKYAITRDFQKTTYFGHDVWYRGICDVLRIHGDTATALDWKTGKISHDSIQLMLMATCIFIHYPEIKKIKTRFVWLKEDCTTRDEWDKNTIMGEWPNIINEVNAMEQAQKTLTFPPKPSGLCRKHCPVNSCVFWGKGGR